MAEGTVWRTFFNEELHNLKTRWVRHVTHMKEIRNAYKNLVGKHEAKRLLGKARRWKGNYKLIKEIG
jgi:hypothetical protein